MRDWHTQKREERRHKEECQVDMLPIWNVFSIFLYYILAAAKRTSKSISNHIYSDPPIGISCSVLVVSLIIFVFFFKY